MKTSIFFAVLCVFILRTAPAAAQINAAAPAPGGGTNLNCRSVTCKYTISTFTQEESGPQLQLISSVGGNAAPPRIPPSVSANFLDTSDLEDCNGPDFTYSINDPDTPQLPTGCTITFDTDTSAFPQIKYSFNIAQDTQHRTWNVSGYQCCYTNGNGIKRYVTNGDIQQTISPSEVWWQVPLYAWDGGRTPPAPGPGSSCPQISFSISTFTENALGPQMKLRLTSDVASGGSAEPVIIPSNTTRTFSDAEAATGGGMCDNPLMINYDLVDPDTPTVPTGCIVAFTVDANKSPFAFAASVTQEEHRSCFNPSHQCCYQDGNGKGRYLTNDAIQQRVSNNTAVRWSVPLLTGDSAPAPSPAPAPSGGGPVHASACSLALGVGLVLAVL